ncbi:MAG: signal peptidase I [Chloroflexota bacterium]
METVPNSTPSVETAVTTPRPPLRQRGYGREILETIILIGAIYALVNLATVRFIVEGPSMQPTFFTGQVLMISRVNYLFGTPQRGQIIVFNAPGQPPDEPPYIKRVIGLPGETVEIRDTKVYIDGKELNEPYINEPCEAGRCPNHTWQLGADEYFFMGDNRNHSSDSRSFGIVKRERVIGEALVRYWPPQNWGIVGTSRYPDNPFVQ